MRQTARPGHCSVQVVTSRLEAWQPGSPRAHHGVGHQLALLHEGPAALVPLQQAGHGHRAVQAPALLQAPGRRSRARAMVWPSALWATLLPLPQQPCPCVLHMPWQSSVARPGALVPPQRGASGKGGVTSCRRTLSCTSCRPELGQGQACHDEPCQVCVQPTPATARQQQSRRGGTHQDVARVGALAGARRAVEPDNLLGRLPGVLVLLLQPVPAGVKGDLRSQPASQAPGPSLAPGRRVIMAALLV